MSAGLVCYGESMQAIRIDHVHLEVSDRQEAADWYEDVLGLKRFQTLKSWADDPMGPLILACGDGFPALSLFAREFKDTSRDTTIAFRVSGDDFVKFCGRLETLKLKNEAQKTVTNIDVVDHDFSWSLYFLDPYENRIEVTTYDYDLVAGKLD